MPELIKDGTGTGYLAKVNVRNELLTNTVTTSEIHDAIKRGKAWNVGTGNITLTSTSASSLLYIKNTGTVDLFIDLYVVLTKSSDGAGDMVVEILRNPTAGTLISSPSGSIPPTNMNFGKADVPVATMSYGAEGKTLSGHDDTLRSQTTESNRLTLGVLTELEPTSSVGVNITPPAGNTSISVECIIEVYEETE